MAKAIALPTSIHSTGVANQINVLYDVTIDNGTDFSSNFVADFTLSPTTNLANWKQDIVNKAAGLGVTLATTDVSILTALS